MTIETYPAMNAKIVEILRISESARIGSPRPSLLYAAQRIEELERVASTKDECLAMAMCTLRGTRAETVSQGIADTITLTLGGIEMRLAELEPEEITK